MKIAKNIYAFVFFTITSTFTTYNMETQPIIIEQPKLQDYVEYIGNILLGNIRFQPTKTSPLQQLPPEVQNKIVGFLLIHNSTDSLETCAQIISALAQINTELNALINNPQFCLQLIKHLALKFDCSDFQVVKTLQTQEAKRRRELQIGLYLLEIMEIDFKSNEEIEIQLKQLIAQGVDLEFTGVDPKNPTTFLTPLAYFIMMNCPKIVQLLIKYGVNVNRKNNIGQTALLSAVWFKSPEIVQILLDAGADPNPEDDEGLTPLEAAYLNDDQEIMDILENAINKK